MDKIYVNNLEFFAYHGYFDFEKENGQPFIISLVLETDLSTAGETDDLDQTVDYGSIYNIAADVTLNNKFDLIETLAERISQRVLLEASKVSAVTVRVDKPKAPGKDGAFHAAVEIRRERK
ncbi:MAG: dihydroneopterin aldolase [Bacillota bacterium]|nr:dihydroneopterin aldolase [Bacillota bacterium]